jgi:hypothetical protein
LSQPEDVHKKKQETFYRLYNYDAVFIAPFAIAFPKLLIKKKEILDEIINDLRNTILADKEDRLRPRENE